MKLIHKEGYKIILTTIIILLVLNYAIDTIDINWLSTTIKTLSVLFLFLILQFFRNPKRKIEAKRK